VWVSDLRGDHIVGTSDGIGVEWDHTGEIVRKFDGRPTAVNEDGFVLGTAKDGTHVVWGPEGTTEPLTAPDAYSWWYPRSIGARHIGGEAAVGSTSVPVSWQRHC
jgi:hypothetical protein